MAPVVDGTDPLIVLRDGFIIRTSVYSWLNEVSFRLKFVEADGRLEVSPDRAITDADDAFIRRHRDELLAAVRYVDEQARRPV
jgi:hypothetical protein